MNFDPSVVEWMHAKIDGVITEREESELRVYLAQNPAAQEHFDELERISRLLDGTEKVAPPASLRHQVLTSIEPSVSRRSRRGSGKRILGYAYAAAAGIIVGIMGYHFVSSGSLWQTAIKPADAAGAMSIIQPAVEPAVIEEIALDSDHGQGTVMLQPVEHGVSVLVDFESPSAVSIVLAFDAERAGFHSLTQEAGQTDSLSLAEGSVSWSQHGHNSLTVMLNLSGNLSTEMEIQINGITGPAHSTRLTLPAPPPSGQESQKIDLENAPSHGT